MYPYRSRWIWCVVYFRHVLVCISMLKQCSTVCQYKKFVILHDKRGRRGTRISVEKRPGMGQPHGTTKINYQHHHGKKMLTALDDNKEHVDDFFVFISCCIDFLIIICVHFLHYGQADGTSASIFERCYNVRVAARPPGWGKLWSCHDAMTQTLQS